jgi:DNA-binding MarR family transcriptional regulator
VTARANGKPQRTNVATRRKNGRAHRDDVAQVLDGLRRVVRALHQSHRLAEHRWRLSAAQLLVLQRLAEAPTLSVNELANRTFTHQSTVSVVVARLVDRGLVRRDRSDDDARRVDLTITAAGRALLERAMSSAQAHLIDALDAMPSARLRVIAAALHDIVEALGAAREPASMFFEDDHGAAPAPKRRR